jgi:hypothetical protein
MIGVQFRRGLKESGEPKLRSENWQRELKGLSDRGLQRR